MREAMGKGIGLRIKAARMNRGISQDALSEKVSVKRETINQWEAETRQIKAGDLLALANALDVSADYLIGRIDRETSSLTDICKATGLTQEAAKALDNAPVYLTDHIEEFFSNDPEPDEKHASPIALEALNALLTRKEGLRILTDIGMFLRAGEFRYQDGAASVKLEPIEFRNAAGITLQQYAFSADMFKAVFRDEIFRLLDQMRSHPPQANGSPL